jgi:predicted nucleotidyltransferase
MHERTPGDEIEIEEEPTTRRIDRPHRKAAAAFIERVRDSLDDAIEALYLFGSVARDSETAGSDVDVLAVIADDANFAAVDDQLLDLAYDVQLEYAVRVEVHAIQASEFAARKDRGEPFVRTVVEEGEFGA